MFDDESSRIQHLLRRTAYGWRSAEWPNYASLGEKKLLKTLIDYDSIPQSVSFLPTDSQGNLVAANDPYSLRRYWLLRFLETSRPLEETMTLFWHWHFATSDFKVQNSSLEWRQNQTLRKYAMGNFREMLGAIAVDPAMLLWLDGNNSKKTAPNENFSRELLELFSMGVDGGYTERDVKQGAKAFTGWIYDDDRTKTVFRPKEHNADTKYYLGNVGNYGLEQTLNIVARHPSTARFISKKLFEFFVHDDPPKEELDRLSKIYFGTNYSIRELVRGVLTSPHFYTEKAYYSRIKYPVQYAVMVAKTLDIPYKWLNDMENYVNTMGQELFNPPNVKGWKPGQNWINTNTMTARLNFAGHAVDQLRYRGLTQDRLSSALNVLNIDPDLAFTEPQSAVESVWNWLLPGAKISEATKATLVTYLNTGAPKNPDRHHYTNRAAGLIELVLTCPEYQLA